MAPAPARGKQPRERVPRGPGLELPGSRRGRRAAVWSRSGPLRSRAASRVYTCSALCASSRANSHAFFARPRWQSG